MGWARVCRSMKAHVMAEMIIALFIGVRCKQLLKYSFSAIGFCVLFAFLHKNQAPFIMLSFSQAAQGQSILKSQIIKVDKNHEREIKNRHFWPSHGLESLLFENFNIIFPCFTNVFLIIKRSNWNRRLSLEFM